MGRVALAACLGVIASLAGCGDHCAEEGDRLASVYEQSRSLRGDRDHLYWLELESELPPDHGEPGFILLLRIAKAGGDPEILYRSPVESYEPRDLEIDDRYAYLLDACTLSLTYCRQLIRVPLAGGEGELLRRDNFRDLALADDRLIYLSGIGSEEPDAAVWTMPLAGGEPTALATGLYEADHVIASGDQVYYDDATSGTPADSRVRRVPLAGGPSVTVTQVPFSGLLGQDADSLYLVSLRAAQYEVSRVAKSGGGPEAVMLLDHSVTGFALAGDVVYVSDPGVELRDCEDCEPEYECGAVLESRGGETTTFAAETVEAGPLHADETHVYWLSAAGALWRRAR